MSILEASLDEVLLIAEEAISIPSLSGEEARILEYFAGLFSSWGWPVERIPISETRFNLLVTFGEPQILFTTHVDVVPAPKELFRPRRENGALFGRGACDAKGIAAAMIGVCRELEAKKKTNFGLLLVVGEEDDGVGAKVAAEALRGRGIKSIINGEPTSGRIITGHKGILRCRVRTTGRATHSGYPELGDDANVKLIRLMNRLLDADLGKHPSLGTATINLGYIRGGVADNVISPEAECLFTIRLVTPKDEVLDTVRRTIGEDAEIEELRSASAISLPSLPGFETEVVAYFTDVPSYLPLTQDIYLYGPGSIDCAHSDNEHLKVADLQAGLAGYLKIHDLLSSNHSRLS